jgi:hypothetical protein
MSASACAGDAAVSALASHSLGKCERLHRKARRIPSFGLGELENMS